MSAGEYIGMMFKARDGYYWTAVSYDSNRGYLCEDYLTGLGRRYFTTIQVENYLEVTLMINAGMKFVDDAGKWWLVRQVHTNNAISCYRIDNPVIIYWFTKAQIGKFLSKNPMINESLVALQEANNKTTHLEAQINVLQNADPLLKVVHKFNNWVIFIRDKKLHATNDQGENIVSKEMKLILDGCAFCYQNGHIFQSGQMEMVCTEAELAEKKAQEKAKAQRERNKDKIAKLEKEVKAIESKHDKEYDRVYTKLQRVRGW